MDIESRRVGLASILVTLIGTAASFAAGAWRGRLAALAVLAAFVVFCLLALTYVPVQRLVGVTRTAAQAHTRRQVRLWTWRPWSPFHVTDQWENPPAVALGLALAGRFNLDRFRQERRPIRTTCTVRDDMGRAWRSRVEHTGFQTRSSGVPRPSLLLSFPRDFTPSEVSPLEGRYSVEWLIEYRGRARLRYDRFRLSNDGRLADG